MSLYLVTGGAGFIGSHLVDRLLADGHEARVLDDLSTGRRDYLDPRAVFINGSVTDAGTVAGAIEGCDGCFHLAAISSVERCTMAWAASHVTNLMGLIHVFDAVRNLPRPVPVVYASSAAVFGDVSSLPLGLSSPTRPLSAYGADKLACELQAGIASASFGIPSAGLRLFNVYGQRQDPASSYSGVISIFAERIKTGMPLVIFGTGEQTRDFVHVGDAVEAIARAMGDPPQGAEIHLVCTGVEVSLNDLVARLQEIVGRQATVKHAPARVGDIAHSRGDPDPLRARYGYAPSTVIAEGLELLLRP